MAALSGTELNTLGSPCHSLSPDTLLCQQASEDLVPYDTDLYQRPTHEYYPYLSSDGESHNGEYRAGGWPHPTSPAWLGRRSDSWGLERKKKWFPGLLWNSENWIKLVPRGCEFTTLNPHVPAPAHPIPQPAFTEHLWCAKARVSFFHVYLLVQCSWPFYK